MANHWFRFYSDSLNNPKVQKLSGDLFKYWVNILCVTSQCDGRVTLRDELSFHLRVSHSDLDSIIDQLIEGDLLEEADGGYIPKGWDERQYKSDTSADRTRKYRARKNAAVSKKAKSTVSESDELEGVTCDVTVTPPDTDTDTDIKTLMSPPKLETCPHSKIIEIYHEVLPELDRVLVNLWAGTARSKNLQARWREDPKHRDLDFWRWYFNNLRESQFHMGHNDRSWKPNLGWLVEKRNFVKLLEKYVSESIR